MDEAGGIRDELDTISLRDVSAMRYVRHQEWMDQVIGNNTHTNKLAELSPRIFSNDRTNALTKEWSFSDPESLKKKISQLETEIKELEASKASAALSTDEDESKSRFVKEGISKLRDTFGSETADSDDIVKEFESKFGVSLIESQRIKPVDASLDLPNYASAPPPVEVAPVEDHNDVGAQVGHTDDILADSALGDDLLADLVNEDTIMHDS